MEHKFTPTIYEKLKAAFGGDADAIYQSSPLLQYINIKTKSAEKGSKARGSFANLYAIYVLVEDHIRGKFGERRPYKNYEGHSFLPCSNASANCRSVRSCRTMRSTPD
jgi:hypothetical protein